MVTATPSDPLKPSVAHSVDPRIPRFGQVLTATGLLVGIVLGIPALIYIVTAALLIPPATRWRYDPYVLVWRTVLHSRVGDPEAVEPAAPHRFAKLLGVVGTVTASVLLALGYTTVGYSIAGLVAIAAGLAGLTGLCIGCHLYSQVTFFERHSFV